MTTILGGFIFTAPTGGVSQTRKAIHFAKAKSITAVSLADNIYIFIWLIGDNFWEIMDQTTNTNFEGITRRAGITFEGIHHV